MDNKQRTERTNKQHQHKKREKEEELLYTGELKITNNILPENCPLIMKPMEQDPAQRTAKKK